MESHNRKVRDRLSKFLKGKRVVVVGPAPSIIGSDQGILIDKYDVVVRLNKALPVPSELYQDIGKRTDILYNCMNPSPECGGTISVSTLKRKNVKFLVGAYPPLDHHGTTKLRMKRDNTDFFRNNRLHFPYFCYTDRNHFLKMWKIMKLPNTGIMAILDLLRFDIKELYVTGFTFFKGGYYHKYRPYNEEEVMMYMAKFNLHHQDRQLKYMAKHLSSDPRVKLDAALTEIIQDELNRRLRDSVKDEEVNEEEDDEEVNEEEDNEEVNEEEEDEEVNEEEDNEEVNEEEDNEEVNEEEDDDEVNDEEVNEEEVDQDNEEDVNKANEEDTQVDESSDEYSDDTLNRISIKTVNLYTRSVTAE